MDPFALFPDIRVRINFTTTLIRAYGISQEICTRFLLCCALLWLYIDIDWFTMVIILIFPISIRLTSLALWQSNDCPSASKATLMNMDKYFMWIHYERLHNHIKAQQNRVHISWDILYDQIKLSRTITANIRSDIWSQWNKLPSHRKFFMLYRVASPSRKTQAVLLFNCFSIIRSKSHEKLFFQLLAHLFAPVSCGRTTRSNTF